MQIENYKILPKGQARNLENKIFGDFKVIYRTERPQNSQSQQAFWLCQCQKCNKYFVKSASQLTKGLNECECNTNLIGKKIGRWTVISLCEQRTKNRGKIYHCKCDCGNEKDVPAETLRRNESRSCGCINKEMIAKLGKKSRIDITGQRFGKLVALYPIYSENKDKHTKWHCKCDCSNEGNFDLGNLRQGFSQSCGCVVSKQEEKIIKMLVQNNIPFTYQFRFSELKNKIFDFYINNKYIIEYDGQQHFYFLNCGWDTKENFEKTRKNDLIKNKYCFDNNIPIIRIPYDEDYTINDLKLETTRFLLTPEKEGEYYESRNNI